MFFKMSFTDKACQRLAEPGEFTKRAFLNGRIDLSQAEAVIDVIQSKNEYALKSSVRQLSGKLSEKIKGLRELVLNNVAYIEAALDDPEHISLDNYVNKLSIDVDKCVDNRWIKCGCKPFSFYNSFLWFPFTVPPSIFHFPPFYLPFYLSPQNIAP